MFVYSCQIQDQFGYFDLQPDWKYLVWPQYDNKTSMEVIDQMTNENFVMVYGNPEISKVNNFLTLLTININN